jgi:Domain of unknown function (DUF4337)
MSTAAAAPAPPKTLWDTILGATPVALTVLATILAGLSSAEMTKAQYHRSLAAQEQSKTSDEWAYFQAKKYRSTYSVGTASQLRLQSTRQPFTAAALLALLGGMAKDLQGLDERVGDLLAFLKANQAPLGDRAKEFQERLPAFRQGVKERLQKLKVAMDDLAKELPGSDYKKTFALLPSEDLPTADGTGKADDIAATLTNDLKTVNPVLHDAFQVIDGHQSKAELDAVCNRIPEEQVRQAHEVVEQHVAAFDKAHKPVGKALDHIGKDLDDCLELQGWAREGTSDLHLDAGNPVAGADDKPWGRFQASLAALSRDTEEQYASASRSSADFTAARLRYNARRYDHEARYNQTSAWLHEIQVNKSSLLSDRYRFRSMLFFIGMLAAQGGVTIATLSLALRRRSILWTLATIAGLTALALSGYVFLFI